MSFPSFLRELGQLIQQRAVISCLFPRLVALDTVNELAGLACSYPSLTTTFGEEVRAHFEIHPTQAILFVSEHLEDGSGTALVRELHQNNSNHRSVLILTENHAQSNGILEDSAFAAIVSDENIGGPTCVLTQALRAVNRDERFIDPSIAMADQTSGSIERLSERELEVLKLVADGLSNKEVGAKLHLAATTVRDHMQSVMRKMNARSRTGAAVAGVRQGLLAG